MRVCLMLPASKAGASTCLPAVFLTHKHGRGPYDF